MLVLTTLKWDVSTVVSTDFIDHLLVRLHLICEEIDLNPLLVETYLDDIRKVATGLCLLCSRGKCLLSQDTPSLSYPSFLSLTSTHSCIMRFVSSIPTHFRALELSMANSAILSQLERESCYLDRQPISVLPDTNALDFLSR